MSQYTLLIPEFIHIVAQKQKEISLRRNNLLSIEYNYLYI